MAQDLEAMTVSQLRQYLRESSVCAPARARKPQLLQLAKHHRAKNMEASDVRGEDLSTISAHLSELSIGHDQTTADAAGDIGPGEPEQPDSPLPNIPNPIDDVSYLLPDFDPASLTVPKLRNLLAAHEVIYATAKTKKDLVTLFEANIAPRAAATVRAMARVERTDEGIVDV